MEQERQVQVSRSRCPYCHDDLVPGEEPVACVQCHALHHLPCLEEAGGTCAACSAAHPRFDERNKVAARRERTTHPARVLGRSMPVLGRLVLAGVLLVALVSFAADPLANDAQIGALVAFASLVAILVDNVRRIRAPLTRTLRRAWAPFWILFALGLLAYPYTSEHAMWHATACRVWGTILLLFGIALQAMGGSLSERPEK